MDILLFATCLLSFLCTIDWNVLFRSALSVLFVSTVNSQEQINPLPCPIQLYLAIALECLYFLTFRCWCPSSWSASYKWTIAAVAYWKSLSDSTASLVLHDTHHLQLTQTQHLQQTATWEIRLGWYFHRWIPKAHNNNFSRDPYCIQGDLLEAVGSQKGHGFHS